MLLILILHVGPMIHILANSAGILVTGSQDSWRLATVGGAVLKIWGAVRAQHHRGRNKRKETKQIGNRQTFPFLE